MSGRPLWTRSPPRRGRCCPPPDCTCSSGTVISVCKGGTIAISPSPPTHLPALFCAPPLRDLPIPQLGVHLHRLLAASRYLISFPAMRPWCELQNRGATAGWPGSAWGLSAILWERALRPPLRAPLPLWFMMSSSKVVSGAEACRSDDGASERPTWELPQRLAAPRLASGGPPQRARARRDGARSAGRAAAARAATAAAGSIDEAGAQADHAQRCAAGWNG